MNPMLRRPIATRGFATILVLVLMGVLAVILAATLEGTVSERRFVQRQQYEMSAVQLAESGIQEAIHHIATGAPATSAERRLGDGLYRAQWKAMGENEYEITAIGFSLADDSSAPAKSLTRRVRLPAAAARP